MNPTVAFRWKVDEYAIFSEILNSEFSAMDFFIVCAILTNWTAVRKSKKIRNSSPVSSASAVLIAVSWITSFSRRDYENFNNKGTNRIVR